MHFSAICPGLQPGHTGQARSQFKCLPPSVNDLSHKRAVEIAMSPLQIPFNVDNIMTVVFPVPGPPTMHRFCGEKPLVQFW